MQTKRLYFDDAYLQLFVAQVIDQRWHDGRLAVALDCSAFFPEGGGQPADRGTLNGVEVIDVQVESGIVWHTLAAPLSDNLVEGAIDWPRRFDHMQQHHGQHLLSAAFEQLFGLKTVSFHLGIDIVTIDLASPMLTAAQVSAAEDRVNQVIWEDRPIDVRFVSAEALARLPLRKPPAVDGPVRVVSVPAFDYSACGGTHPRATGAVGLVHIRRWERRGESTRVVFLCGGRAARDLREKNTLLGQIAQQLSVAAADAPSTVARLRAADAQNRKQIAQLSQQLIAAEARALVATARDVGGVHVVCVILDGRSIDEARALARAIAEAGYLALVGLRGEKTQIIAARAAVQTVDVALLVRSALTPFGGRGGGQPTLAQWSVPRASDLDAALEVCVQALGV